MDEILEQIPVELNKVGSHFPSLIFHVSQTRHCFYSILFYFPFFNRLPEIWVLKQGSQ